MTVFNIQEGALDYDKYKKHQEVVTAEHLRVFSIVDEDEDDLVPKDLPDFLVIRAYRNLGAINPYVNQESKILDIGCRTGIYLWFLKQQGFKELYGIEIDDISVGIAKKRGLDNVIPGDAHKLPYDDNFFSAINCTQVIEHSYSPHTVLKEMRRVLKKDGVMWIDAPLEGTATYAHVYNYSAHHCFWVTPQEFAEFLNSEFKAEGCLINLYPPDEKGRVWAQGVGFLCKHK
jgi:SAM-dependent methyltransferase